MTDTDLNKFEIKTPDKKNEIISTSKNGNYDKMADQDKESIQQKRIAENKEREERKSPNDPTYQDADWTQEKMNEANNENANAGALVDEKGLANENTKALNAETTLKKIERLRDTREDSILSRPKTETYEKQEGESIGDTIKKDNYVHGIEEEKRDKVNRRNHENAGKKA